MHALISLHDRLFGGLQARLEPVLVPTLARLLFVATLMIYYFHSGLTKLGEGFFGFLSLDFGAYAQILPRAMEAAGYDVGQLGFGSGLIVLAGTWAEFLLPALILIGLFTRLAALGMIGFVLVQTYVDVVGHGAALGGWFDRFSGGLIDERSYWVFPLLILVLRGAGPISVDAALSRHRSADFTPASQPR